MKFYKKRWIQSGVALIGSLAIVLSVFPTFAEDTVSDLENQTSSLEKELDGINKDLLELSKKLSTTEMQVTILDAEIARTEDNLKAAEENENQQYEDMKARIKYMYEHGNASLLEMLFSAEDMTDFLNKADFIENLSEYDRTALDNLKSVHQEIADQKAVLETQQASLSDLQDDLQDQKSELQAKADATSTDLSDLKTRLEEARQKEAEEAAAIIDNGGYDNSVINGGGHPATEDEVKLLAALLQCEAYQDYDSLLAVATVIMNRVADPRFPNTISGVIYAEGQFEPTWTGRLETVLKEGPTDLSYQVAQDAVNGARLSAVAHCYFFLYAGSGHSGINIGGNVFFESWT